MNDAEETYANCSDCLARPEQIGDFERLPTIRDPVIVRNWEGVTTRTALKHIVDVGNIIAKYEIDKQEYIECSLNGHEHFYGHIARTRCGLVVRQGNICARNSLRGMKAALEFFSEREKHLDRIGEIRTVPEESLQTLSACLSDIERSISFQRANEAGPEGRLMRQRLRRGLAKGSEVLVRSAVYSPKFDRYRVTTETIRIQGLKFWSTDFEEARCSYWIAEAENVQRKAALVDAHDRAAVEALADRCVALLVAAKKALQLAELGRTYLAPYNREVVKAALSLQKAG